MGETMEWVHSPIGENEFIIWKMRVSGAALLYLFCEPGVISQQ